jgi:membrane protein
VLWELARLAFSTYIHTSGVYGRIYGSFGIWIAALIWLYYSSSIFIFGAELAAVLTERRRQPVALPTTP